MSLGFYGPFSFGPLGVTNKPGPNWIPSTLRLGPSPPPPPLPSLPPPRAAGSATAAAAYRLLSAGATARSSELALEGGRSPISPRGPAPPACPLADAADVGEHQAYRVSSFPGSLARMSLVCIGCEIFLLCSACSSSMEDSNALILPCKRKNKGQGKDKVLPFYSTYCLRRKLQ